MSMKKKVKCKCSQCGKKLIMTYYTAVVCDNCMGVFYNKVMDRVAEYAFGRKDNEREQENG